MHDDVKTVIKFLYLGDRINSGRGCETAVTSGTRTGLKKFRDCQNLYCGKTFHLKITESVYKGRVRTAMLYGSETWCLG